MAKQIIVLQVQSASVDKITVNALAWLIPSVIVPNAMLKSAWAGASVAENAAIAAGTVIEEASQFQYASNITTPQIEADLLARFNKRQAAIGISLPALANLVFDSVTGWSA